ncbi:MAG: hypothetical protein HYU54_03370 [Actinobacteria bacterium]|nr:hypothetical protein [Actinomycetota bacterium]
MILGTLAENRAFGVIAATGVVLSAIYLLWAYQRMAHGEAPPEQAHHGDLTVREYAILAPVVAAILLIGVYPKLLLDRIDPTTARVVQQVTAEQSAGMAAAEGGP